MEEARQELHRIINDREMKDSLLLVFANKQDLDNGESCCPELQPYRACREFQLTPPSFLPHSHEAAGGHRGPQA